jgi:hypothetical protein
MSSNDVTVVAGPLLGMGIAIVALLILVLA